MAEKSELERQFKDLDALRTQVSKLKEELAISRRLDWIRQGLFPGNNKKGGELLIAKPPATTTSSSTLKSKYDLNVEVNSDGTVHVVAPATNRPAAAP